MSVLQARRLPSSLQELLESKFHIVWLNDLDTTAKREEIKAIFVHHSPRNDDLTQLMRDLPNLKAIVNYGVGVNHIDLHLAKEIGIKVSNTPNVLNAATADLAFGILLAAARNIVSGDAIARHPSTQQFETSWLATEVSGSVIGIVGMGRIGMEMAKRARGFDMKVIYHNRRRRKEDDEAQVQATFCPTLIELLQEADFVVAVVPVTEETRLMFKAEQFASMKRTAFFVNVCRGAVVDHSALTKALETQQIAGMAFMIFVQKYFVLITAIDLHKQVLPSMAFFNFVGDNKKYLWLSNSSVPVLYFV
jgi:glyoxylate reductase